MLYLSRVYRATADDCRCSPSVGVGSEQAFWSAALRQSLPCWARGALSRRRHGFESRWGARALTRVFHRLRRSIPRPSRGRKRSPMSSAARRSASAVARAYTWSVKLSTVSAATSPQRSPSTAPSQTVGPWSPSPSATAASWSTSRAGRSIHWSVRMRKVPSDAGTTGQRCRRFCHFRARLDIERTPSSSVWCSVLGLRHRDVGYPSLRLFVH